MNRCARSGYLVDATRMLPADATELDVDGLPVIGCNRIRCERCNLRVRNVPGYAFKSDDVPRSALVALYNTPDPTASPLLQPAQPQCRLYFCTCSRWLETSEHGCEEPDPDPQHDPSVPWACEEHAQIALPHEVDGVRVASAAELRELVQRALAGRFPPRARPADTAHGAWLIRLYIRLQPAEREVVAAAARAALDDADPGARGRALALFTEVADGRAQQRLIEILGGDRALYAGVPDAITAAPGDITLEETIWRVLAPLVAVSGPARAIARADALKGRGSIALYAALAFGDSGFVINNLDDLAQAAPAHVADLAASLSALPAGSPVAELRAKLVPSAPARASSLDAALDAPGSLVAAWDGPTTLRVFNVGSFVAKELGRGEVPAADRAAMDARLADRGLRVGHASGPYVWVAAPETLWIWSADALIAHGTKGQLANGAGEVIVPAGAAKRVTSDARGVSVGDTLLLPAAVPGLAAALAAWLGVPHGEGAMTNSLDAALAGGGSRVGAWDYKSDSDRRLAVYKVGAHGAELAASGEVDVDQREDMNERMRARGVRIGGTHRDQRFVWAMDAEGATIWSDAARVFELQRGTAGQITRVVTFFGPKHRGQRGVRTERAGGGSTIVVEENDETPSIDPTYGQDQLEADIEWAYYLGQDLALWLDVPHYDQLTDEVTNDNQRAIAQGTRALARLVAQAPLDGPFAPIEHSYGAFGGSGALVLRVEGGAGQARTLELRVTPPRSSNVLTRTLKRGTSAQIAAFLFQLRTPSAVLRTMNALLR